MRISASLGRIIGSIFLLLIGPIVAYTINTTNEGYKLTSGQVVNLTLADASCKKVTNNATNRFIPTKTMTEWNSFNATAAGQGVSITTCCDPNVGQACSGGNISYYWFSSVMSYSACQSFAGNWGMTPPCPEPGAGYTFAWKQCSAQGWFGDYRLECAQAAQGTIQCDGSCQ